ncbi:MAG: DUF1080 domain-containing protein [Bryobacteraceae bacterium]
MTHRLFVLGCLGLSFAVLAQNLPDLYTSEAHGDPPFLSEKGWRPLLNGTDLTGWHAEKGASHEWFTARSVRWKRVFGPTRLAASPAPGDRIVNGAAGKTANLVTEEKFQDLELFLEFMLAKGSNSGVYLHGLYEVQIFDSYGYAGHLTVGDCGGIYGRNGSEGGSPPLRNAARPPGEWQSLHIWFRAPRFDSAGKKVANARFLRVLLNDVLVQDNFEVSAPTQSHVEIPEAAENPLMLQGDHGPVAYRNIYVRPLAEK